MLMMALSFLAVSGAASGTNVAPVAATQARVSDVQQKFDAGAVAIFAKDWAKAFAIYSELEARLMASNPKSKSLPIVRLRKARALFGLDQLNEAEILLKASLESVSTTDANLHPDRQQALIALGEIAERNFDYPGALSRFRGALSVSDTPAERLDILLRLIRTGIFVDPNAALADANLGLSLLATLPEANRNWPGVMLDLRARTLLNLGRIKEARLDFDKSIKLLGRLGAGKMDLNDGAARSDAAIAATRDNDPTRARELLAYSGAAQQSYQQFRQGVQMEPPACALNGPRPEDVAVVEFSIREDGSVGNARPVYFSGKPSVAVEFAKAVSGWSWTVEQMKSIDFFFRAQTRVELRCTTVFERPSVVLMLKPAFERSLSETGVVPFATDDSSDARIVALLKAELARREAVHGAASPQLIPVLIGLRTNAAVEWEPSAAYAQRALQLGQAAKLSPQARSFLGLSLWQYIFYQERNTAFEKYKAQIVSALADSEILQNPEAANALRLQLFDVTPIKLRETEGRAVLQTMIDDHRLEANDPFRVAALTRLANLEFVAGRTDAARANFEKSGLSAQQCALVDASPVQVKGRLTAGDYPDGAADWGFSGWTVIEFDIGASGVPTRHRALVSFPPFIFGPSVIQRMQTFQYQQSYRPGGGLGCGGARQGTYFTYAPTKDTSPPRKASRP